MTEESPGTEVSIIIVNYNSGELLANCLRSITASIFSRFEVIIYDNASTDASIDRVTGEFGGDSRIQIIRGPLNLGFSKANNLAVARSRGRLLHFLNPDMQVNADLNHDYKDQQYHQNKVIGVTGLTDANGKIQKNRYIVPRLGNFFNGIFARRKVAYWNVGASVIMSQKVFDLLGGWPEDYFIYAEDLDLFYSSWRKSIPVSYSTTTLLHLGKGCTGSVWNEYERRMRTEASYKLFLKKYRASWEYYLLRPVQLIYGLFAEPESFLLNLKVFLKNL